MPTHLVSTHGLSHYFEKGHPALSNLDLQIEEGSIYGFLGPNGSGKTTTLRLLLGLLPQQEGRITLFGRDLREQRTAVLQQVGALIETPSIYAHLTARENLEVFQPCMACPLHVSVKCWSLSTLPTPVGNAPAAFRLA
jgi:ABC-type multidrug transport system ATPase subunit